MYVEGFCSISSLSLNFDQNQIIWIKAHNGSGKSSIFSALVWCLYGKTIKGVSDVQTWKEYQPKDYTGAMVTVSFQHNESIYQVIRCQKYEKVLEDGSKGKDRLILMKDAELLDIKSKPALQQKIVEVLGLSQALFTNSIMFGQGINRIIQESNADKKKLFEEIFDLNYLNIAKGIAMEDKSHILSKVNQLEAESAALKRELDINIQTYRDLKDKESKFANQVKAERRELKETRARILTRKSEIEKKIGESMDPQIKETMDHINKLKSNYQKAKSVSNIPIREFIEHVYDMIQNKKYQKASKELLKLKDSFEVMDSTQDDIDKYRDKLDKLEDKQSEFKKYQRDLMDIDDDLDDINKQLKKLKENKLKILSPEYKESIKEVRAKLRKIDEDYHNKELELANYNWLIEDPLGNNGIKAYLFDSSLDMLNRELARYADVLGFRIAFEMDLSSTRKEFVTSIERDGHIIDYDELSGGEKTLVDLSMAFAMNQALTASKGINIAFMDELFESLSSDNIELVIQLIKEIYSNRTLFLISHHDSLPFSNVKIMEVEKRKGLSFYQEL
jgi:DNA repair exonuclease SbcCD ATPase subunit